MKTNFYVIGKIEPYTKDKADFLHTIAKQKLMRIKCCKDVGIPNIPTTQVYNINDITESILKDIEGYNNVLFLEEWFRCKIASNVFRRIAQAGKRIYMKPHDSYEFIEDMTVSILEHKQRLIDEEKRHRVQMYAD